MSGAAGPSKSAMGGVLQSHSHPIRSMIDPRRPPPAPFDKVAAVSEKEKMVKRPRCHGTDEGEPPSIGEEREEGEGGGQGSNGFQCVCQREAGGDLITSP